MKTKNTPKAIKLGQKMKKTKTGVSFMNLWISRVRPLMLKLAENDDDCAELSAYLDRMKDNLDFNKEYVMAVKWTLKHGIEIMQSKGMRKVIEGVNNAGSESATKLRAAKKSQRISVPRGKLTKEERIQEKGIAALMAVGMTREAAIEKIKGATKQS